MSNTDDSLGLRHPRDNSAATLTSLAIINVNWESKRASYLDNFVPYALETLRLSPGEAMSDRELKAAIAERFGLDFPVNVVTSLVGRAIKQRLIARDPKTRTVMLAEGAAERLPDIAAQQQTFKRQHNHLVRGLVAYAQERFEITWDDETAGSALVDYIESQAVPLLASSVRGSGYTANEDALQGSGYVVSAYVAEIVDHDPPAFNYIDEMVKGSMLASALYLETPGDVQRRFKRTTLYLDTPVCLRALGHEGPEAQEAAQQMLRLALSQGAELACFTHNLKEMRGILDGTKNAIRRSPGAESAMRGVATHFRTQGYTENDVNLFMERLEQDLQRNRIQVKETPEHTTAYGIDEAALEDLLQSRVHYKYEKTRLPDLNSLTAIHRLRRGASGPHLETCGAVLVTNNSALVRASREFFNSGRHEWPLAMLDHTLAALVWVKEPTKAPDLPRHQVMADCYAALAPSPSLWLKIADEIDRLSQRGGISSEDVALLRYSNEAQQALMDVTLGDPGRVSPKNIHSALAKARQVASAPAEQAKEEALARAEQAEAAEGASRFQAATATAEADNVKQRLERLEERDARRRTEIRTRAQSQVRWLTRIVQVFLLGVLVAALIAGVASFFPDVSDWMPNVLQLVVRIGGAIAVPLSLVILWKGKSIQEWTSIRRENLERTLEARALRRGGLDDGDSPQQSHEG